MEKYIVSKEDARTWLSNPEFKAKHKDIIEQIIRAVYEPLGYYIDNGKTEGAINLPWDDEQWSILNRLNTSYLCLYMMINSINETLINANHKPFIFPKEINSEFYIVYNNFILFLQKYRDKLFKKMNHNDGSNMLNEIIRVLNKSKIKGDYAENLTIKYLKLINSNIYNIKLPETSGQISDMWGGVDISFNYKNKEYTVQVKNILDISESNEFYILKGTMIGKHYKVDYLSAVSRNHIYFFKYHKDKINILESGDLEINKELFYKKFDIYNRY